jgi:hypothetical protein
MKNIMGISTTTNFLPTFSRVIDTAETVAAVSLTSLKRFLRCQFHR